MRKAYLSVLLLGCAAPHAMAVDFIDVAPVVSVTPLYGPVTDARDCIPGAPGGPQMVGAPAPGPQMVGAPPPPPGAVPPPGAPQERSVIAPVIGGVAGGLIGSQVGSGRGRDAAAAVGAVAGTVVADRVANPNAPSSTTGAVVGGAAGALLGNQVGQGSGRTAATAAGAIGGAMVGDRVATGMQGAAAPPAPGAPVAPGVAPAPVAQAQPQPCRTVDGVTTEAIRGYSVVYRYAGRDITTTLPFHPGPSMRVAIGAADNMTAQPAGLPPGGYQAPPQRAPQPIPAAGGMYSR